MITRGTVFQFPLQCPGYRPLLPFLQGGEKSSPKTPGEADTGEIAGRNLLSNQPGFNDNFPSIQARHLPNQRALNQEEPCSNYEDFRRALV